MLLVMSQKDRWEESLEEYLIQLGDRSETAITKREKNNINWGMVVKMHLPTSTRIPVQF